MGTLQLRSQDPSTALTDTLDMPPTLMTRGPKPMPSRSWPSGRSSGPGPLASPARAAPADHRRCPQYLQSGGDATA